MNLASIKTAITSTAWRQILITQKNSPAILFGVGVAGVITTVVMASRATLYLDATLDETNKKLVLAYDLHETGNPKYTDEKWAKDKAVIYTRGVMAIAKLYWPAVAVGVISIGALSGSHIILSKRNIGLTAAYAALEKGFNEYRARVADEFGAEADRDFRYGKEMHEVLEETAKGEPKVKTIARVGASGASIYARFFDEYSTSWERSPEHNRFFIQCQQDWLNDRLKARGHVFLNEAYDALGIDRSNAGAVVGWLWLKGGDSIIDFGVYNADSERARSFVNGREGSILLDFNVDGVIWDKI